MITQYELDKLVQKIQAGETVYIYYAQHMMEDREGFLDDHIYRSLSKFKVVKVRLVNVQNAFFEYKNFLDNPNDYHEETVTEYYDVFNTYVHRYTVKNEAGPFDRGLNPRTPSIIYGYRRQIYDESKKLVRDINDPSPVNEIYTNNLEYGDLYGTELQNAQTSGKLDWKYMKLTPQAIVDGINFSYVYSNWYILELADHPTVEKPLINVTEKHAFFCDKEDAFYYIEQLQA